MNLQLISISNFINIVCVKPPLHFYAEIFESLLVLWLWSETSACDLDTVLEYGF